MVTMESDDSAPRAPSSSKERKNHNRAKLNANKSVRKQTRRENKAPEINILILIFYGFPGEKTEYHTSAVKKWYSHAVRKNLSKRTQTNAAIPSWS